MTQLTPHFTLEELIASDTAAELDIDNGVAPGSTVHNRLCQLAGKLEDVRAVLGDRPILVSSGYRCVALNTAIGGAVASAHLYGCAADFTCPEFGEAYEICEFLSSLDGFIYDQLINEEGDGCRWVHLGLAVGSDPPRCNDLTIASGVTKSGFYPV